ncbi:PREDICTED: juxtaposed with another zinc finger protein 1 [Ceratosolen solmsi marchali]|uniref:Juxtaposed with another zinc finger protein 1 n=1 Tax=Ceratosolen solmsi marchali TaxID=326594 RepID=A0AAJ6YPS9_9HYME|nr:PREDICTED: juxtaposed with another zinc finger protein 1 [Ceratosolen solmsi marchali]
MAVFMLNVCKFNSCGLTFKSLGHLIQHIEETHIDYDPHVVEKTEQQQPPCIPLSYVLRFLTDAARRENIKPAQPTRPNQSCLSASACVKSLTPTGSEAEEGEDFVSEPEDSNDSWTTLEEFSTDFILRYGSRNNASQNVISQSNKDDKPFACPVPGCKKRYKNVNGIKYHSKNGHKNDGKIRKAFKCPCGKSYKTPYGLKNHMAIRHNGSTPLQVKLPHASSKHRFDSQPDERSSRSGFHKMPKMKVSAIQDHGYIKQEHRPPYLIPEGECEPGSGLGILTPASSPPLPSPSQVKTSSEPFYQKENADVNSSQGQSVLKCIN